MEKQPVRVTIFHQTYSLLAQGDTAELERAAQMVDELMNSIATVAPTADTTRIAVLACLHLADRLRSLEAKTEAYGELLDKAMASE
ncbi:MAG: cell division protein ZapA [Acidobacteriota bacterium]|nr:cell division protein ZapA [Acidobacteriota bacterium]